MCTGSFIACSLGDPNGGVCEATTSEWSMCSGHWPHSPRCLQACCGEVADSGFRLRQDALRRPPGAAAAVAATLRRRSRLSGRSQLL
mmetsp:Transcript_11996/g.34259  ORF Transcript_11996/g.34259 Transcript_11996/m.34259 type:complete len:87 (-) Transcript_11996:80-340(-)